MITLIKQNPEFSPEIGDFLFAPEFIHSYVTENEIKESSFLAIPLVFLNGYQPFFNLEKFCIDIKELKQKCMYECPFRKNTTFYGLVPFALKTNDAKQYRQNDLTHSFYDFVFDTKWQKNFLKQIISASQICQSFLGHGYTNCTLPTDGSNKIVNVKLQLSNDDFILAHTWEWYNK